ncbi:mitochondrial genome maintenance exonuclease 1 [Anguilla anguilla]|uniref:mitochondrial genome maintenance exonuclease 1 n=1 Tax=Anguilla anguilla TaxID=7936 RepID=UPI0015AD96FC|nr:mitochondrial genome maintenance exonuclease 1 [Anguilla anguilla]
MKFCQLVYRVKCVDPARLVTGRFSLVATGSVSCISTSCLSNARKKTSQYSSVDTEKYSSLVKSVVSLRISSQTPASLEEEDGHIYGPVVKSKPATKRSPKTPFPLVNSRTISDRIDLMSEAERGPPIRIALQRGAGRSTTPSVTRILQQTMPPDQAFYLERWKKRMIAELGEEGFKEYTLNIFRQGKQFHTALETILMAGEVPAEDAEASEAVEGYLESIQHVLQDISDVRAIESAVQHQSLGYLGLVDCVAQFRGKLCVIDWKTSEKPKPFLHSTYDNPLQVAAYIGALNNDDNYKYQVERGLIVVAYKDGTPAHPHAMTSDLCQDYWTKWLLRLEEFVEKKSTASEL